MCRLLALTFRGKIQSWFEALLTKSIHTWEQFMDIFLISHQNYNYDELCSEQENFHKQQGETLEQLFSMYMLIFYRLCMDDLPSKRDLI